MEEWTRCDPLTRFYTFLVNQNILTETEEEQIHKDVVTEFDAAFSAYETLPPPTPDRQFKTVYAEPTPQLQQQEAQLMQELGLEQD